MRDKDTPNVPQVDPDLIPYLLAADSTPVTDTDEPDETPTETQMRDIYGQALSDAQLDLLDDRQAAVRPISTLRVPTVSDPEAKAIYADLLSRRAEHQIEPTLEHVKGVLDYLGDPQKLFHSIHVTGTNGKTSIAAMIAALTTELGYRTGRFTSPHLSDVRERISVDGEPISIENFIAAYRDIEAQLQMWESSHQHQLSFFEVLTVMTYAFFADVPVNLAVVEVGMGGRWDATNTIDADTAVLGPISLEHEQWLGKGLRNIATEKSGIIKQGANVVCASQPDAALEVITAAADAQDAVLRLAGRDFEVLKRSPAVGGQVITVRTPAAVYEDIFMPLYGEFQAENAAVALTAVESQLGGTALDALAVQRAFEHVSSPGRLEVVHSSPMIVVDAGHNPGAVNALIQALEQDFRWEHVVGIYAAMADKAIETVLGIVEPVLDEIIVTQMPGERAASLDELQRIALDVFGEGRVWAQSDLNDAIAKAGELDDLRGAPPGASGIIVFGSVVLAGMARDALGGGN